MDSNRFRPWNLNMTLIVNWYGFCLNLKMVYPLKIRFFFRRWNYHFGRNGELLGVHEYTSQKKKSSGKAPRDLTQTFPSCMDAERDLRMQVFFLQTLGYGWAPEETNHQSWIPLAKISIYQISFEVPIVCLVLNIALSSNEFWEGNTAQVDDQFRWLTISVHVTFSHTPLCVAEHFKSLTQAFFSFWLIPNFKRIYSRRNLRIFVFPENKTHDRLKLNFIFTCEHWRHVQLCRRWIAWHWIPFLCCRVGVRESKTHLRN